jgi:hypothetical protein
MRIQKGTYLASDRLPDIAGIFMSYNRTLSGWVVGETLVLDLINMEQRLQTLLAVLLRPTSYH